jgi:hypothetical protein
MVQVGYLLGRADHQGFHLCTGRSDRLLRLLVSARRPRRPAFILGSRRSALLDRSLDW